MPVRVFVLAAGKGVAVRVAAVGAVGRASFASAAGSDRVDEATAAGNRALAAGAAYHRRPSDTACRPKKGVRPFDGAAGRPSVAGVEDGRALVPVPSSPLDVGEAVARPVDDAVGRGPGVVGRGDRR